MIKPKHANGGRKAPRIALSAFVSLLCFASAGGFAQSADPASAGNGNSNGNHGWTNNPYNPAYDHPWRHGALPTKETQANMHAWNNEFVRPEAAFAQPTASSGKLSFGGGTGGAIPKRTICPGPTLAGIAGGARVPIVCADHAVVGGNIVIEQA